jgi:glutathione S-transferase
MSGAKLYYTTTSCGASNFTAAFIGGLSIDCEQVDLMTHKTDSGADFYTINPKGNVPCVVLADGTVINENVATLNWIADQTGNSVRPAVGSSDYYKVLSHTSHVASEIHQAIGSLFNPAHDDATKAFQKNIINNKMTGLEKIIKEGEFLVNNTLSIADLYLFICLSWTAYVGVDISGFPVVVKYMEKVRDDPKVAAARDRMATKPTTVN